MTPMLSIVRLTKRYGEKMLFDLQDFKLDAARAYVLTGMNGAGKSTLMRVLAGLAPADAVGVRFNGEAVTLAPYPALLRRDIVYVHQHPVLFSTSVAGNIGYGLKARGVARAEAARLVEEAMHWAGVRHLQGSRPATLSGGEKQRVALARAKVLQPRLLLLDEPTASLDGEAREQVLALIPSLTQSGSTVVMACHDRDLINLPDVQRLKLRDGQLEEK
ncbi:energy-coupling factor ABC transporter ATP-binding protein [Pseudoduganella sp. HUAS MS19]